MGAGGIPNRGIEITEEKCLPKIGKPNSRIDRYKNGKKVQSRWYDNKGRAERNRDFSHSGNLDFPHDHQWTWINGEGFRGNEHLTPDFDDFN